MYVCMYVCTMLTGRINSMAVSSDGLMIATSGDDKAVKIYDVTSFDMIRVFRNLSYQPSQIVWTTKPGSRKLTVRIVTCISVFTKFICYTGSL